MLRRIRESRERDEGFTLIELMVVVLIIAILIAIAIPTFLGARQRAQDRAAQSDLRNGLTAAKTIYTDNESYLNPDQAGTVAELGNIEPSQTFVAGAAAGTAAASGVTATDQTVILLKVSGSGDVFAVMDDTTAGTTFCQGAAVADCDTAAEITASEW